MMSFLAITTVIPYGIISGKEKLSTVHVWLSIFVRFKRVGITSGPLVYFVRFCTLFCKNSFDLENFLYFCERKSKCCEEWTHSN